MMKLDDSYLELTAALTRDVKLNSYRQLGMGPGSRHLEVGAGGGHDSIALARLHPEAVVTGVDLNDDIVQVANTKVREEGLTNISHLSGDASALDYPEPFTSMRAERVFQHLGDEAIHGLVAHLSAYAAPGCVFSMVGVDWETLTCTVSKAHRHTFRQIKQFLVDNANITFVHTAIDAFEAHGFVTGEIDTWNISTGNFNVAMRAFNLEAIASQLDIAGERFMAMRQDFLQDKHYFCVSGCSAPFIFQGR